MTKEVEKKKKRNRKKSTGATENKDKKKITELEERICELEKEKEDVRPAIEESNEKVLRALAELENFKKRKNQELESFRKYAVEELIMQLLPVLDSFDRACEHSQDSESQTQEVMKGFILIQKQFHDVLDKAGITQIESTGKKFDHNYHQAIMQEESEEVEPDTVIKEMQKGYKLHEKVIRPAMVVVSK
ncbi:MAG: nucleotide exchange factor GrpE [bacterium]|nr:nucleotide exchange factor GrpE [bacterium]